MNDHVYRWDERAGAPRCPTCGSRRVARAVGADVPRFVGTASGPPVQTKALEAIAVDLTVKSHG